jgi:hypothetical protein
MTYVVMPENLTLLCYLRAFPYRVGLFITIPNRWAVVFLLQSLAHFTRLLLK